MIYLSNILKIISFIWYSIIIYNYSYEYFVYSSNTIKLEDNFQCKLSDEILNNKLDLTLSEQYYYKQNARIPNHDRLYLLSNSKNHVFSLAYMETPSKIKYYILINYNKENNIFCKKINKTSSEIISSTSETNNRYYAVKNYGNTYFIDPTFELIKILSIDLPSC